MCSNQPNQSKSSEWSLGPDELCPADSYYSNKLDQPVLLRQTSGNDYKPISIYTMFSNAVAKNPGHNLLAYKVNNVWNYTTFSEYWKLCHKAAKSFIKLGLDVNSCVAIIGFNAPQWFMSLIGAIFAGGVGCGMYTTNTPDACEYILKDSKSQIVVVENKQQLDKILKCVDKCSIKAIVQYTGTVENSHNGLVLNWDEFINAGDVVPDQVLQARIKTIAPNKCATLIYTSGTTGSPKAAMISHDSVTFVVRYVTINKLGLEFFSERLISYLPLSHIAAQIIDVFTSLHIGATVYFASPDVLKGSLVNTLQDVRPTLFFGVPRVWEKIQEKMESILRGMGPTKLRIFEWARSVTHDHMLTVFDNNEKFNASYRLAKMLVLNKIYKQLGLDQCRVMYSGAAPITKDTLDFFISLGMPLCEVFGMSETTGPHTIGLPRMNRVTAVGTVDKLNQTKLDQKNEEGAGELCIFGRHVFMGYLNEEAKTRETFDKEGWLRTGDIAKVDSDGFLYITGRLKELIITAGGENIAPLPIEDNVKAELPRLISNCMLVGDKRKYLTILVTLKSKVDPDTTAPLDQLTDDCINFLKSLGSMSTRVTDIINNNDPIIYNEIENAIKRANEKSQSRAAKVQKFSILERDFSLAHGELGPTLKLRRPIVHKMYANAIEELYYGASNE